MSQDNKPQALSPPKSTSNSYRVRWLALEKWDDLKGLSPVRFAVLLDRLSFPSTTQYRSYEAAMIERACSLIFILVGTGGACVPSHIKLIEQLRIDPSAALLGFIRWPPRRYNPKLGSKHNRIAGPRQFLHQLGRLHLKAYVTFRLGSQVYQAQEGDLLLPPLSREIVKKAAQSLTWLQGFPRRITWSWVYRAWLQYHLSTCNGLAHMADNVPASASVQVQTEIALWHLLSHEPALLLEARRGRLLTAPLPDNHLARFVPRPFLSGMEAKQEIASLRKQQATDPIGTLLDSLIAPLQPSGEESVGDRRENFSESEIDSIENLDEDFFDLRPESDPGIKVIRGWLHNVADRNELDCEVANEARTLLRSDLFCGSSSNDLCLILKWVIAKLEQPKHGNKGNRLSSIFSNTTRLLTILDGLEPLQLTRLSTLDLAAFLDDYATANTAKAYKAAVRSFYSFLVKEGLALDDQIDFKSRSLYFSEGYRERTLITEEEFQRVLAAACRYKKRFGQWVRPVLILLRRAGLRCGEVTSLTPRDFHGLIECRLFVRTSKTKAGKRALPLYLLLDKRELQLVTTYVAAVRQERGADAGLVIGHDGASLKPEVLGQRICKLLQAGGVYGQTAHGLRHAFASGLLAAWWLRMADDRRSPECLQANGWTRRALLNFGRSEIEGRAVDYADDIRRLLGHADLAITFERYIHTLDLVAANAIGLAESHSEPRRVTIAQAAQLVGVTDRAVRQRFKESERGNPLSGNQGTSLTLTQVEDWLDARLVRATQ
jgi:integrase